MELTRQLQPDIIIADVERPKKTGPELADWFRHKKLPTRVIIVTTKVPPGDVLPSAIRTVCNGGRTIDPKLPTQAWSESDPLSDRERQVLRLSAAGLTNLQIAADLNTDDGTVRNNISEAISKLDANNRIDAARIARDKGWL